MPDCSYAAAPFDHAKADIILRSSDNIDFRVFKPFLSLASPFFKTFFDIPQPAEGSDDPEIKDGLVVVPMTKDNRTLDALLHFFDFLVFKFFLSLAFPFFHSPFDIPQPAQGSNDKEVKDGLVVVPIMEDSKTLNTLLRFCYPCTLADDPKIEVLKDALDVLEAARRYSLDAIEKKALQAITNPRLLETDPLQCFVIARRGRLREETLLAAKYTLTQPLIPLWFPEIKSITAADLLSLLTYHKRCGDAVYGLRLDLSWITSHYRSSASCSWLCGQYPYNIYGHLTNCGCPRSNTPRYALFGMQSLQWWEDYMEETFTALRGKPCKGTLQASSEKTVQSVKSRGCQGCSAKITDGMHDFVELLARKIEEIVSRIELGLQFEA